ncbi:MAG: type I DNA topoisomerase, partial [Oscillospiraceae bacterium]|nr:type I DNA topoisomerase [Oscillospiraceae bacterium]
VISELKSYAKKSDAVYLATDPDREGEAISWHIAQMLNLDMSQDNRVAFTEITKSGIQSGMSNPHKINIDLVNAQQARRILDRIVGYKLSPFLWKKVRRGLSAGRVQSVAVRLIVDKENEINSFTVEEFWTLDAKLSAPGSRKLFDAKLISVDGNKAEIKTGEQASAIYEKIKDSQFKVAAVKNKVTNKQPSPPFITSTLQQEASKRLSFTAKRTMKAAQELYEGIDIEGMGAVGLITYMRTDSLRISDDARSAAVNYITGKYGKEYLPPTPRYYKKKANQQDAHEAIRPSMPELVPEKVKSSLTTDQYKLYKLIWERFMASQMANAQYDSVSSDIAAGECIFRATGYSVKFPGFTALYEDVSDGDAETNNKDLPPLETGMILKVKSLDCNQHFTQPPPRYTEATLIKALEENGIGRPSTYAPTITTIVSRQYVEKEGRQLIPTNLGIAIIELMKDHFENIVDAKFTAKMETDLDDVESGQLDWVNSLEKFYKDFEQTLTTAETAMEGKRVKIQAEETDIICSECGQPMVIKIGKFGKFLACSAFPACKNTMKITVETKGLCPLCGSKLALKKSKRGRSFYGCQNYPNCNFMTWNQPTDEVCEKCGSTLFTKPGKTKQLICEKPDCDRD